MAQNRTEWMQATITRLDVELAVQYGETPRPRIQRENVAGDQQTVCLKNVDNVDQIRNALRAEAPLHGFSFLESTKENDRLAAGAVRGNE